MKNIGEILKEARERRGFSRDVLADLISVSKETIARWGRVERSPDARALKKIATALSVSISNLLGDFDLLSADTSEHKEQSALEKHAERKEAWDRAVNTTPPNGASDAHYWKFVGDCFSLIDCEKDIDSVLKAILKGNVEAHGKGTSNILLSKYLFERNVLKRF